VKLSIIIPTYNEEKTVREILRRVLKAPIGKLSREIIIVNDGSTDKTLAQIKLVKNKQIKVVSLPKNQGKGAAIRAALKIARGDVFIIQDADLEYDPDEYVLMLQPILDGRADVVYGSRLVSSRPHRVLYFWHALGNNFLTFLSNLFTNLNLSDMETCYKMFTNKIAQQMVIEEDRFGFEPEFTAKVSQLNCRIYEVGISYSGRSYKEGKKIDWKDGLRAIWYITKYSR
jgi:glycosyltransferase involved in cell wall biosynthesis